MNKQLTIHEWFIKMGDPPNNPIWTIHSNELSIFGGPLWLAHGVPCGVQCFTHRERLHFHWAIQYLGCQQLEVHAVDDLGPFSDALSARAGEMMALNLRWVWREIKGIMAKKIWRYTIISSFYMINVQYGVLRLCYNHSITIVVGHS